MNNRDIIYRSLEIMEENLKSDLTLTDLSERLGYSLYYFIRLFKGVTGETPKAYLNRRKLTAALEELKKSDRKIIDLAYDYGFGTPESFSRAFHKMTGMNPAMIRKGNIVSPALLQPPLTGEKLELSRRRPWREPELMDRPPLRLMGISLYYNRDMPDDLSVPWQSLINNKNDIPRLIKPERFYQIQYWMPRQEADSLYFFLALEVDNYDDMPIQFTAKTLPAQKYLRFFHKGRSNEVGRTYEYIYDTYLPGTDYKLPHLFNFEYYGPEYKGPYNNDSISEIYIPVSL